MDGHATGDGGKGILGRTFWIQGRSGPYWQNLESHEDGQSAIGRLGLLVGDDRYDELRLIQADLSPITGKTSYVHIVTVRDGQVLEPAAAERTPGSAPHAVAASHEPGPEPQMHFWPEPHPDEVQPRLNLYAPGPDGEPVPHPISQNSQARQMHPQAGYGHAATQGYAGQEYDQQGYGQQGYDQKGYEYEDTGAPRPSDQTPRSGAFHANPGQQTIGGWRIPEQSAEAPRQQNEQRQEEVRRPPAKKSRARRGLSLDPHERQDGRGRINGAPDGGRRGGRNRRGLVARGLDRFRLSRNESDQGDGSRGSRAALLSGVFAGALAAGLALASLSPQTSARFYGDLVGDLGGFMPSASLVDAIEGGDLRAIRARLLEGADPNATDREGMPLLLRAARAGNLAALTLLLQAGADPTLPLGEGRSAMHILAAEGRGQALARILAAGAPLDLAGGNYGCLTPLSVAAANGRVRAAGLLADQGASLSPQESCKVGPMEVAAPHPHVLARLEQVRAKRESLLRIAAGPAPTPRILTPPSGISTIPEANSVQRAAPQPVATNTIPATQPTTQAQQSGLYDAGTQNPAAELATIDVAAGQATGQQAPVRQALTPFAPPPKPDIDLSTTQAPTNRAPTNRATAAPTREAQGNTPALANTETVASLPAQAVTRQQVVAPQQQAPQQQAPRQSAAPKAAATSSVERQVPTALIGPDGTPRARTKPVPPSLTPGQFAQRLRAAIDAGDAASAQALLSQKPARADLNRLRVVVRDRFGAGERSLTDHAALSGRSKIAQMLTAAGGRVTPSALHTAIKHTGTPGLTDLPAALLELGADPNGVYEGLTPLMRASLRGDVTTAMLMMQSGANPALVAGDGRTASDMAGAAGKTALQERLLMSAREADYGALMLGMSWSDTLETLESKAETCKSIGDDFTACKMKTPAWIQDAAVVVAQFDGRNGNRLVAIQIDSQPLTTPRIAKDRFAAVVREIEQRLPTDHVGFSTANAPEDTGFFRALRPEINSGAYFAYWPDQDKSRPVFVHLKLSGINDQAGFYRIIIGNPFRTG